MIAAGTEGRRAAATSSGAAPPLWRFIEESGLESLVIGTSKDPNAKITIILLSPGTRRPVMAVKVPTTDAAARAVVAEERVLTGLHCSHPGLAGTVPRVVGAVEHRGRVGMVTEALAGTPMTTSYMRPGHTADPARVRADFAAVDSWLAGFQRATAGDPARVDMAAGVAVRLAERFADDRRLAAALDRLDDVQSRLRVATVPRTAVHGDLWCGNVLIERNGVSGVVDWEAGSASGEPVRDLVRFAVMYALFLDRRTRRGRRVRGHAGLRHGAWGAGVDYAVDGDGWFPDLFRAFLRRGLVRLGASPSQWRDATLAGLAEVAAFTDDPGFARSNLDVFLRIPERRPATGIGAEALRPLEEVSGAAETLL